jgi:ATP-dependent helicase/nuclease subunit A
MASAGTGKTYMLVNRLVRLLLAGARPDAILAITFTRKAAAEMQGRLAERLLALASAPEAELAERLREMDVEVDQTTMERARRLFEALLQNRQVVRTTTFHAFCQEILLRFPLEADVPPGFELLDSSAELLQSARDALLAETSVQPDGELAMALRRLLDYCGGIHGLERALETFIAHRGDWWAYTEEAGDALHFATERLQQQLKLEPGSDPLRSFFSAERQEQLAQFAELLARHPNKGNNAALEALADARNPELPTVRRFAQARTAFLTQKNAPKARKASQTQAKKMGVDGEERFLDLHQILSQAVLDTLEQITAREAWHACADWYRAGIRLLQHYQQLKEEQRVLDFTDLEWRAYRLLTRSDNALWVQYKLDQRIDHLLVDEFQDTNPTQWRLLLPLLQEMAATDTERSRSVFLVGDAKQSIYRFRRAEPRLFQAAHHWLREYLDARAFPLHTSWRSAPAIMQCVNKVFDEHGPLAGRLRDFSRHDTNLASLWGKVEVLPLIEEQADAPNNGAEEQRELRNPLQQPRTVAADDRYQREGQQIADEIRRLVAAGTVIGSGGDARPLHYGDIMILVRKRTHSGYYEQALRDTAIPYTGAERGTLLQSLEVSDMVALLEVLLTPYNNLSLAAVLRSPLFACSDEDLKRLAAFDSGGWYQRLLALAPTLPPHQPLGIAATLLEQWRQLSGRIPIHDLLDRIFSEGNVVERYRAAFPPHLALRAVANLTRFLELALEIDSGRYPSLGHFLARLGEMRDNSDEAPDEAPVAGSIERVRILTIHASKGLEAPVVFIADSAQGSSAEKAYRTVLEWPPEAARPVTFLLTGRQEQQPALIRRQLEREKEEQQRESANLLYVALTRARQMLYISGVRAGRGDDTGWYGVLRQALDPLEQTDAQHACTIQTGQAPESMAVPQRMEESEVAADVRLSQPLKLDSTLHEIAPSYLEASQQQTAVAGDEDGRMRGIIIHRLLQEMSDRDEALWPRLRARIASEFGLETGDPNYRQWFDECRELFRNDRLKPLLQPNAGVESLNEVPIIYKREERTVHGVIDRLLLHADEVWLVDYKSHQHANRDNCDRLADSYRQQLAYYAMGVQQLWPDRKVRRFLLFTSPQLLYEVTGPEPSL